MFTLQMHWHAVAEDTTWGEYKKGTENNNVHVKTGHGWELHIFVLNQNFPIIPSNDVFAPSRYTTWDNLIHDANKSATLLPLLAHHLATHEQSREAARLLFAMTVNRWVSVRAMLHSSSR